MNFTGQSILIVDDDKATLRALDEDLRGRGCKTRLARSGGEALEAVRRKAPDLVLLDLKLPDLDGYEVCRRIKEEQVTCFIPVIIFSASSAKDDIVRALDRGADDFLAKPIYSRELYSRINVQLRNKITFEKYREFFEHASDGLLILSADLRAVDANRRLTLLTGYGYDELTRPPGMPFLDDAGRSSLEEVVRSLDGEAKIPCTLDLPSRTAAGEEIILSGSLDRLPGEDDDEGLILSLRDVTATRKVQDELARTKNFLENVIRSSVDAIMSADMKGDIIIFNEGAEKISGYRAEEVIGRLNIADFYSPGVARDVMKKLRSADYGGPGKLETCHNTIIAKDGEEIPINISASIIYEDGYEVATVGIFTDLRDRIFIEKRLQEARDQLMTAEKQGVVAELAGAAAHELNQPLTSIRASAEMMLRRASEDDPNRKALGVILDEADRMAAQVKKIGQITSYETKHYLGETRIIDIDRSLE